MTPPETRQRPSPVVGVCVHGVALGPDLFERCIDCHDIVTVDLDTIRKNMTAGRYHSGLGGLSALPALVFLLARVETLTEQNEVMRCALVAFSEHGELGGYLARLKHRAKVRGGPDTSAMHIADEALKLVDAALSATAAPQSETKPCP